MFTAGMSTMTTIIFSALTFTVSVPSAIKVFNWLATMFKGSISLTTPMVYTISFIFLFTIGGLTGLHLGTLATDMHLHDTYFVVAHFHYVMVGGTLVAFLGGVFHWWPKMVGKMYSELGGVISGIIVFFGFNLTFLPQFVLGSRGMPRRYATYDPEFQALHEMSTYGALMLGVGLFAALGVLLHSLARGRKPRQTPGVEQRWNGTALLRHRSTTSSVRQSWEIPTSSETSLGTAKVTVTSKWSHSANLCRARRLPNPPTPEAAKPEQDASGPHRSRVPLTLKCCNESSHWSDDSLLSLLSSRRKPY